MRKEMVTMPDTDILEKRLVMATALSAILEVSWDILDLIQQIASGFSGPDDGWAFRQTGAAARRGCYALAYWVPDGTTTFRHLVFGTGG
jgi:hypothetical protein